MRRSFVFLLTIVTSVFAAALPFAVDGSWRALNTGIEARADSLTFKWSSTGPLIGPKNDGKGVAALKDPSIVFFEGAYHVFASTASATGYNMMYFTFTDFASAQNATFHYLDATPIGKGYRAAPQVFYFAPQKLWYLIYQDGNAAFSTNPDITNPAGWTAPKHFYTSTPATVTANIGKGAWLDMWVICDTADCFLFSEDDNGHVYRSSTTLANFPSGMGEPTIALSAANKNDLFEASNVYKVGSQFLLIMECIGATGHRYFRSFTASTLGGAWTALAATEASPFAGTANVAFPAGAWTADVSHGEAIRTNADQTMTLSACGPTQYLYQGLPTGSTGGYDTLPWKLALLTSTTCTQ